MDCKFLHFLCFDVKIKAKNSNNPPREKKIRARILPWLQFNWSKNFFQSAHDLYFIRLLSPTKCQYRDKKLNSILRRQYDFILTALGGNIFRIGLRPFATPPNTEYIFSQLAVNIKSYCRLKIEFSLWHCLTTPVDLTAFLVLVRNKNAASNYHRTLLSARFVWYLSPFCFYQFG